MRCWDKQEVSFWGKCHKQRVYTWRSHCPSFLTRGYSLYGGKATEKEHSHKMGVKIEMWGHYSSPWTQQCPNYSDFSLKWTHASLFLFKLSVTRLSLAPARVLTTKTQTCVHGHEHTPHVTREHVASKDYRQGRWRASDWMLPSFYNKCCRTKMTENLIAIRSDPSAVTAPRGVLRLSSWCSGRVGVTRGTGNQQHPSPYDQDGSLHRQLCLSFPQLQTASLARAGLLPKGASSVPGSTDRTQIKGTTYKRTEISEGEPSLQRVNREVGSASLLRAGRSPWENQVNCSARMQVPSVSRETTISVTSVTDSLRWGDETEAQTQPKGWWKNSKTAHIQMRHTRLS